jgi:hypothetical protein
MEGMSMVVTVPDGIAARLRVLAVAPGESIDVVATELLESSPQFPEPGPVVEDVDLLEAFIGCGSSGDSTPWTIHEMRRELCCRQTRGWHREHLTAPCCWSTRTYGLTSPILTA